MNAVLRLNQRNSSVDSDQHLNLQQFKGQKMGSVEYSVINGKIKDFIIEKKILIIFPRKLNQYWNKTQWDITGKIDVFWH